MSDNPLVEEMLAVLQDLVLQLDEVTEATHGIFVMAHAHGLEYHGPHYGDELAAAKELLKKHGVPTERPTEALPIPDDVIMETSGGQVVRVNKVGTDTEEVTVDQAFEAYEEMRHMIEDRFSFHSINRGQEDRINAVRYMTKTLAKEIVLRCPDSRERSLALTKLEEVMFHANSSIAREKDNGD